jgi:hypothetical protein
MLFLISPGRSRKRNGCVAWVEDMVVDVEFGGRGIALEVFGCRSGMSQWNVAVEVESLGNTVAQEVSLWNEACQ